MKIKISTISGFCMGVKKAIDNVLEAADVSEGSIYIDGPVIHNPQVITMLKEKGVQTLRPDTRLGSDDTLIIRAHGIPPEREKEFRASGCTLIDSTCPLVSKIQKIIKEERSAGKTIVIMGEKGHPEIIGLAGYTGDKGIVIESVEEIDAIPQGKSLTLVAQSTQEQDLYQQAADTIKSRFEDVQAFDTICKATHQRQSALKELAQTCDAVIVVGGKNSGNTKRLVQIASGYVPAFHIETAAEISPEKLEGFDTIGIAGGASTPDWLIEEVKLKLEQL